MNLFKKLWIEKQKHRSSFSYEFSIPISNITWKQKVIEFDLEFLVKSKKFGLFYFGEDIIIDYEEKRRNNFSDITDNYIELLSLRNYFPYENKNLYKFVGESYINIPCNFDGHMISKPSKYDESNIDYAVLEFENFPGLDLNEVGEFKNWEGNLNFLIYSSSNIWWEEIDYVKGEDGVIYKLKAPVNNRSFAYRITPRFNSLIRDLRYITARLGGSIMLEDYDKRFVAEGGILLDDKIVYQEDIDDGRISLQNIDHHKE